MRKFWLKRILALSVMAAALGALAAASETENHRLRFVPAAKPLVIDGKLDDWDLRAGVFAGAQLEQVRDKFSLWLHGMYDAENVYILARWRDETPLNNPEAAGGHGFNGDSLQMRFILFPNTADKCATWWDMWRDHNGKDVVSRGSPGEVNHFPENVLPNLPDAIAHGAKQAFSVNPDGRGYVQEICIPWKLLSVKGAALNPGDVFRVTAEPNFTAGAYGRISVKDIFNAHAEKLDRVFTFNSYETWGEGVLLRRDELAGLEPDPVRLSGGRTFPVTMRDGVPEVNWEGLFQRFAWPGFKKIEFTMPFAGYVSLNVLDSRGRIVRHLQNWEQYGPGKHVVEWDGLADATYRTPGAPVPAGDYAWRAVAHKGVKLTYRGQAGFSGRVPWNANANDHWLGDHGAPSDVETDGKFMYLACDGAEGGRHLICTDLEGNCVWGLQNTTGAFDPNDIAVDGGNVYVLHRAIDDKRAGIVLSLAGAAKGDYKPWQGRKLHILSPADIYGGADKPDYPDRFHAIDAAGGKVYLTTGRRAAHAGIYVLNGQTGALEREIPLADAEALDVFGDVAYVLQAGQRLLAVSLADGKAQTALDGLDHAVAVTVNGGRAFVSERGARMCVNAYDLSTKQLAASYGRQGGRPVIGKWQPDAMYNPAGTAVAPNGRLWVAESYVMPKRVSVWALDGGKLVKDFFGPTHYGASGGAICPSDPNVMVGEACEWRLDPQTGRASCVGVFDTRFHGYAKFVEHAGKLYLSASKGNYGDGAVVMFLRTAPGEYRPVFELSNLEEGKKRDESGSTIWVDLNGDGKRSADEVQRYPHRLFFDGSNSWSTNLGSDMSYFACDWTEKALKRLRPTRVLDNGAPLYEFAKMETIPGDYGKRWHVNYSSAVPNVDNTKMLLNLAHPEHPAGFLWTCVDMRTWETLWTYPNPYFQVHGSHKAPAYEPGIFRGAYNPIGSFRIPALKDDAWVINGNLGEWYLLTGNGYYLSRVFNGNNFEWAWPAAATPGADMTNVPSGGGGEDFGGSAIQGDDGKVYLQSGKVANWNVLLSGLEDAVVIEGSPLTLSAAETAQAQALREKALQAQAAKRALVIKRFTPDVEKDSGFAALEPVHFQKSPETAVDLRLAYDDQNLYCQWLVNDATPWVNGSKDFSQVYAGGDTVDLQLGVDFKADPEREKAVAGDLRLAIGPIGGKDTAVLYRFVSEEKKKRTFSSGVVQGYEVDYVDVAPTVTARSFRRDGGYIVNVAVPWKVIGVAPSSGLQLRGDFGATHGDPAGQRTRLRTYWANQQTGLVDDVVFELQLNPKNWGEVTLE